MWMYYIKVSYYRTGYLDLLFGQVSMHFSLLTYWSTQIIHFWEVENHQMHAKNLLPIDMKDCKLSHGIVWATDYGHSESGFFFKISKLLGLGSQIGLNFFGAFGIFSAKLLALICHCEFLVQCPWENVAGSFSYKKLLFLGLKHINPKCSQNKILTKEL